METKTCRFGTILDSATRSTSWRRFFEIHFCYGESLALFPFKLLILTIPAKIVDKLPSAAIVSAVFFRTCPWHHQKTEQQQNCRSEQDVDQVLYSAMDGRQCQNKDHGDTVQKPRGMCLCSLCTKIKSEPGAVQYCRICVDYLSKTKFPSRYIHKESKINISQFSYAFIVVTWTCIPHQL